MSRGRVKAQVAKWVRITWQRQGVWARACRTCGRRSGTCPNPTRGQTAAAPAAPRHYHARLSTGATRAASRSR
eukprot:4344321-Prymnesium_polylepis.1